MGVSGGRSTVASMEPIARLSLVALDCPDTQALAEFYAAVTGWRIRPWDDDSWIQLVSGDGATIAFQKVEGSYTRPVWPGQDHPQQLHLDFDVPDLDTAEAEILGLGAGKAEHQPYPDNFRVFLDPAGHPFCLVRA